MLTQLSTVKSRLALTVTDYDDLLTNAIKAVSDRFDKECNRNLARITTATHEFDANDTDGWVEQTGVEYLIRRQCVISLLVPINYQLSTIHYQLPARSHHVQRRICFARRHARGQPDRAPRRPRTSRRRAG